MNHRHPNQASKQTIPSSKSNQNNRFSSSVKNSLQTCMGFVDGLCCASLNQVSEDREERRRDHLRDFMTSYDLSYLNSNVGAGTNDSDVHSTTSSRSDDAAAQEEDCQKPPASESTIPVVEKPGTTHTTASSSPVRMMHTIVPNSMLPREYGTPDTSARSDCLNETSNPCCHSFPQYGFENDPTPYAQPHTLPAADTYTTVSLSQSYTAMMWDDDEDEEDEEELSSDYRLSPVGSVFRTDDGVSMEESKVERDGPPTTLTSSPFPTSAAIATKTHEAYQYLLRMKPQNYLHSNSGSSSEDMECSAGELLEENNYYCHSNSNNILGGNDQCGPLFLQ